MIVSNIESYSLEVAARNATEAKGSYSTWETKTDWIENFNFVYDLIIRKNYKRIVELGVHTGQSSRCLLSAIFKTDGLLICIDPLQNCFFESFQIMKDFKKESLNMLEKYLIFYETLGENILRIDNAHRNNDIDYLEKMFFEKYKVINDEKRKEKIKNEMDDLGLQKIYMLVDVLANKKFGISTSNVLFDEIDLLHIDTEHTYVETYYWLISDYLKKIKVDGTVLFHHILTRTEVSTAIDDWLKQQDENKFDYKVMKFNTDGLGVLTKLKE